MEHLVDRYASPLCGTEEVNNVAELLMDSEKKKLMCLLGCDEKYKNGLVSDFECLARWDRVYPLCRGTGVAALYEKECARLGFSPETDPKEKWRAEPSLPGETIPLAKDQIALHRFVSDFARKEKEKKPSYRELIDEVMKEINALKTEELHLILRLPPTEYIRSDPYGTEQIYGRWMSGEKCNQKEELILLCGILISVLRERNKGQNLTLHLFAENGYETVFAFLDYLRAQKLFSGTCMVGVFLDTAHLAYDEFCKRDGVHPELILTVSDFAEGFGERMGRLFRHYPASCLSFGGILTDSPLYGVAQEAVLGQWKAHQ